MKASGSTTPPTDAVAERRLDDRDDERLPDRRPRFERVDEHVGADDRGVEDERDETERERSARRERSRRLAQTNTSAPTPRQAVVIQAATS